MGRYVSYDRPPVVEALMGVQFDRLPITLAHYGWFWKQLGPQQWPKALTAPHLDDAFERPGERTWAALGVRFEEVDAPHLRMQFVSADDERMLQFQDSRLIYNWRKREGAYPSFDQLRPEFDANLASFSRFLHEAELPQLAPNQWEVTYVNFLPRGELWDSPRDWPTIFPTLSLPLSGELDTFSGAWSVLLGDERGRLHVDLRHSQARETRQEIIKLQLTARGPVTSVDALSDALEVGHRAIVTTFDAMTSKRAHEHWGKR